MRVLSRTPEVKAKSGKCIYCHEQKEFSNEHYLPECLGKFEGFQTLDDRICHDCNNRCGRELEDQFCRAGHIGYMRFALGIGGKRSHKEKVHPFERGSSGSSPLRMKGKIPGQEQEVHLQLVRGKEGGGKVGIDYVPQIILETESGEIHYILLTHMKEPEELEAKLKELGIEKFKQASLIAAESEIEWVEKLTSRLRIAGSGNSCQWQDALIPTQNLKLPISTFARSPRLRFTTS